MKADTQELALFANLAFWDLFDYAIEQDRVACSSSVSLHLPSPKQPQIWTPTPQKATMRLTEELRSVIANEWRAIALAESQTAAKLGITLVLPLRH